MITNTGDLYLWGWNGSDPVYKPKLMKPFNGTVAVTAVALGAFHVIVLGVSSGKKSVYSWGSNKHGQLAQGTSTTLRLDTPTIIESIPSDLVVSIASGEECSCIITSKIRKFS